jgi:FtsP/CotA-like multicopper oxidase with cupredoxin domain
MDSLIKLGEVKNGRVELRAIELDRFNFLISSERSARVREPHGRMILRGQSPSTRPFPPDLLEFSVGGMGTGGEAGHHEHESSGWPMPPVPPGLTMLPAEMALRPEVAPYLPGSDSAVPVARPREVLRVANGDTIQLAAGLVRRTINGQTYTMYGYNEQYPGPLIEAARGSEIVVRFKNQLPDSSSIHWHGIRLDNPFDGVAAVAADHDFTYRVRFPDAGVYWYHPHVREDIQQELGLYGNLLVRAEYGPANREEVLMLDDLLVGESGLIPLGKDSPTHALMGRFGNLFLVNGEPGYRLAVRRGEVVRFYLTNASSTRTLNVSFPAAHMKVVATDAGPFEHEAWVESVVIAPAERYVVHVRFDRPGPVPLVNQVRGLDHLFGRFFPLVDTLGVVSVSSDPVSGDLRTSFATLRRDTATTRALEPYRRFLDKAPDQTLVLTLQTHGLPFVTERLMQLDSIYFAPVEWGGTMPMMNWASTGRQVRWVLKDPATGRENMEIAWHFRRGDPVKLRFVNERRSFHGMQHPIHLHGQRFLVLSVNGVPNEDLAWKDTVLVPAGAVVDILLDTANPGEWMLHCHIAEHLSAGMMMHFTVD